VTLLAEKRAGKGGGRFGRAAVKTVLKDLGEHPGGGGKIQVLDGKYGPYVSWNKVNATVPKGSNPETLTVDDAVRLLQERMAKGGKKPPAKKTAKPKAKAKETADEGEAKPTKAKAKPKAAAKSPGKKPAAKTRKSAAKADAES
jgi:DNA topoisomerase-1